MNAVVTKQDKPLAVAPDTDAYLSLIERAARDPQVDVDKMERLMQMQERVLARNAEQQFNDAMMQAQAQIGRIAADRPGRRLQLRVLPGLHVLAHERSGWNRMARNQGRSCSGVEPTRRITTKFSGGIRAADERPLE